MNFLSAISPFNFQNQYTGNIQVNFWVKIKPDITFSQAISKRLTLQPFVEPYQKKYLDLFGNEIKVVSDFNGLFRIFKQYTDPFGQTHNRTADSIRKMLIDNSSLPLNGNPLGAFAIIDNHAKNMDAVIGCICMNDTKSYEIYLDSNFRGKKYGKEAILLFASLIFAFHEKNITPLPEKLYVEIDSRNQKQIDLVQKLGFKFLCKIARIDHGKHFIEGHYEIKTSEIKNYLYQFFSEESKIDVKMRIYKKLLL